MYVITTNASINLAIYFVDVIQRATVKKKMSLPFSRFTYRVTIMAKIPLCDNDPIINIYGKILVITIVKSKVAVS
jgi:hypothetical protein